MASPGQIDHVLQGIAALPEKGRKGVLVRYLSVYLEALNDQEQAQQDLTTQWLGWEQGTPVSSFIYDVIGSLLDQPRPDGFDNEAYRFILLARTRVRRSSHTLNDVLRVADFLARGFAFIVQPVVPQAYVIAFFDLGLTDQEKGLYESLLLDTVGQVDQLDLSFVSTGTALYDSLVTVFDVGLYA